MNASLGEYSLFGALLASALTTVAALGAARQGTPALHRLTRWGFGAYALMLLAASAALLNALCNNDFSLTYVAAFTERALSFGYKLSAFWAGQEGSLLFWAVTLAAMSAVYVFIRRGDESREHAIGLLVLALIGGFFAAMLLFAANPFATKAAPADGHGLNPMLQNIGMIAHPPTLFIGYAGFTIPFALMIGALAVGKPDAWIAIARRWVLFSWIFLTVGIVLGAQWAYVELGWGGYWAWDPVENASLLPWLTGTALLHSVVIQQHRSIFKLWNVALAAASFILCIFGTYITRSGVIQSVHAFQPSLIGSFFLAFLVVSVLAVVVLVLFRWRILRFQTRNAGPVRAGQVLEYASEEKNGELQGLISREGAVLLGNTMLVFMMLLTLLGTVFPLISGTLSGNAISVKENFYNVAVLPLAIVTVVMMAAAPLLMYGSVPFAQLLRKMRIPLAISIVVTIIVTSTSLHGQMTWRVGQVIWTVLATFAVALTVSGIIADYITVVIARGRNGEGTLAGSIFAVLDANHRRYGGHLAHLGMAMLVAGVAGSSLYTQKESLQLAAGDSAKVGSYTIRLDEVRPVEADTFSGFEAILNVTDRDGQDHQLRPQIRKYEKWEQNNAEVAFITNLREDVYVSLLGFEDKGSAAIQVLINPLVIWIWIGGIAMTIGGLWAMLPTLIRLQSKRRQMSARVQREEATQGV